MTEPLYSADGLTVRKRAVEKPNPDGTRNISLGFNVCHVSEFVGEEGAEIIARALNLLDGTALGDVAGECERQFAEEGWTPEHDDAHDDGSLAEAAAAYALMSTVERPDRAVMDTFQNHGSVPYAIRKLWPASWDLAWLKPKSRRRDLERAGALIVAELGRLKRLEAIEEARTLLKIEA